MMSRHSARNTLGIGPRRVGFIFVFIVLLAGCSVKNIADPIDKLEDTTSKAGATYTKSIADATASQTQEMRARVLNPKKNEMLSTTNCGGTGIGCSLVFGLNGGTQEPVEPALPQMLAGLADSLIAYTKGLKAVVHATTGSDVDAAVTAAASSVAGFAQSLKDIHDQRLVYWRAKAADTSLSPDLLKQAKAKVDQLSQPGSDRTPEEISGYAPSIGGLFSWIAQQYIAYRQLDGLRRATAHADPIIQRDLPELDLILQVSGYATITGQRIKLDQAEHDYYLYKNKNGSFSPALFDAYSAAVDDLNSRAGETQLNVFAGMAKAHAELTKQLASSSPSLTQITIAITAFSTKVSAFQIARQKVEQQQQQEALKNR